MDTRARFRLLARGVAMTAALGAIAAPATAGAAPAAKQAQSLKKKQPTVTRIVPMDAKVGDTLTIYGTNFRKGKGRNSVAFKADGRKAIFVTADISTKKQMKVVLPARLEDGMVTRNGGPVATPFRVRVLAFRFGKKFTKLAMSPIIGPEVKAAPGETPGVTPSPVTPPAPAPEADCDGDGAVNSADPDDDGDLLSDVLEAELKTDPCKVDTDGDGIEDGYEYKSAIDLNDDEYQQPNESLPYPKQRPYPNPLFNGDRDEDFDQDGLTLHEEYELWVFTYDPKRVRPTAQNADANAANRTLFPLTYSDGEQYSLSRRCTADDADSRCGADDAGRRIPAQPAANYDKQVKFLDWAADSGYRTVRLNGDTNCETPVPADSAWKAYGLLDFNRDCDEVASSNPTWTAQAPGPGWEDTWFRSELYYYDLDDNGWISDDERDEDADGLTNYDELHGRMTQAYWNACYSAEIVYPSSFGAVDHVDPDSDGDGVRDGADDQDRDDVPNVMELSRNAASGYWDAMGSCTPLEGLPEPPATHHNEAFGWVQPFDPCSPTPDSRTCSRHPGFDKIPSAFNASVLHWVSLN